MDGFDQELRTLGEGQVLDLAYELEDGGELDRLVAVEVDDAFAALWPRLRPLVKARKSQGELPYSRHSYLR